MLSRPRFFTSRKLVEERVARRDLGGERRPDELELRLAIGILDARRLLLEHPRQSGTSRTASSSASVMKSGSASVSPGTVSVVLPHPLEPAERRRS